jgi:hypothetical protein
MSHNPFFGVIGEESKESDYQIGSGLEIPRAGMKFQDKQIQYNQKDVSGVSCTLHGAIGAFSDLTGYVFPLDERKALWEEALKLGADPEIGWYTNRAVDLVRKHVNKDQKKVSTFRVSVGSEQFFMALRLGYSVVVSHRGNSKYNDDKNDGILEGLEFGNTTYGHCLRISYSVGDEFELLVNNYVSHPGTYKNIYKVPSDHLKKLVANNVFFPSGYIFTEDFAHQMIHKDNVPIWATVSWEKALKKGIIDASSEPLTEIGDYFIEKTLFDCGILNKKEGGITLARWVVALDRMNQL